MMRLSTNGPRSVMRTVVDFPLVRFVTRTTVLKGSVRCAAVSLFMSYISPLDAWRPWNGAPYHEAFPSSKGTPSCGVGITDGVPGSRLADSAGGSGPGCTDGAGWRLAAGWRPAQPVRNSKASNIAAIPRSRAPVFDPRADGGRSCPT